MNKSASGNRYEEVIRHTWKQFESFLDGEQSALFCVLSSNTLDTQNRNALEKTAEALGYGSRFCTFINTNQLDEESLFLLIEGLDPYCLVIADSQTAQTCAKAFRCPINLDAQNRIFGRIAIAFSSLSSMMNNNQSKQDAWQLLKRLPKRN